MSEIVYDINSFTWNTLTRCFYADAWDLHPIKGNYKCSFPNMKRQFFIKNPATGNFQRFRFVRETSVPISPTGTTGPYEHTWVFENDGTGEIIECYICVGES